MSFYQQDDGNNKLVCQEFGAGAHRDRTYSSSSCEPGHIWLKLLTTQKHSLTMSTSTLRKIVNLFILQRPAAANVPSGSAMYGAYAG